MILEEKIVRYVILASIFYGLFNLIGQFGSFLSPFIFDYAAVSLLAVVFAVKNRKEKNIWTFILLTLGIIGITVSSGQFIYLINLFAKGKVEIHIPEWIIALSNILLWASLGIQLIQLIKLNSDKIAKYLASLVFVSLVLFIVSKELHFEISWLIQLLLFYGFFLLVFIPKLKYNNSFYLSGLILLLIASLEVLRLISILYLKA